MTEKTLREIVLARIADASQGSRKLDLSGFPLITIPPQIAHLTHLTALDLSSTKLITLPKEIFELKNLTSLDLFNNHISNLPKEIRKLDKLISLELWGNQLNELPSEVGDLTKLESLNLSDNKLVNLPEEIGRLSQLISLKISRNELANLPKEIGMLDKLVTLDISGNKIEHLPKEILNLGNLGNLNLADNPLSIPPEILKRNEEPQSILNYCFLDFKRALNECKVLVVGQGSVGKTSLIRRLLENTYDPKENKTEGIDIRHFNFQAKGDFYNINVWDFGGQEIMHATHQFFLTKRSLYLLVLDSRLTQEENRVEYWLKMIQSFGGDSPVLIVGNKTDQHPLDVDRSGLQKKYLNAVGIFEASAATGKGIKQLQFVIAQQILGLPHVSDLLPETWFTVKKNLESLGYTKNFIHHDEFVSLCNKYNVTNKDNQSTLISFLHDLGVILHFQDDPRLEALGILNPQWVTNGVYKILNAHALFENKGVLSVDLLNEILDYPEYPRDKRIFIVDMMKKFELCYDIQTDKTFLVPDLLPKDEPFTGEWGNALTFQYHYAILPSSVITRFIVRMNDSIYKTVWRLGVVLKNSSNVALIKGDLEDKKIYIWVNGAENTKRDFLSAIRSQFETIHKTITKLEVREKVPVPGQNSVVVDFEHLLMLEQKGIKEFIPEGMKELVSVRYLLNGVATDADRQRGGVSISINGNVDGSTINIGEENKIKNNV